MRNDRLFYAVVAFAMICVTVMVTQCSYNSSQCKLEAIKSGKLDATAIRQACTS